MLKSKRSNLAIFLRAGLPICCFIVGGSWYLSKFVETKVEIQDKRSNKSVSTRKFNLEEERRKMLEKLDIDNYNLSRIPRPDDGNGKKVETRPK